MQLLGERRIATHRAIGLWLLVGRTLSTSAMASSTAIACAARFGVVAVTRGYV